MYQAWKIAIYFYFFIVVIAISTGCMTILDLRIIGHLKSWKKIKYPYFFRNFWKVFQEIDKFERDLLIQNNCTYPQVVIAFCIDFLSDIAFFPFLILLRSFDQLWLLWIINNILLSLTIFRIVIIKTFKHKALKEAAESQNKTTVSLP